MAAVSNGTAEKTRAPIPRENRPLGNHEALWRCSKNPIIPVYYGCADTSTGIAFGYLGELIEFAKQYHA